MKAKPFLFWCVAITVVLSALFTLSACKKRRNVAALPYVQALGSLSDDAFGLVITTNLQGYIEPCGCTSDPLGGIARFTTLFNDFKAVLKNHIALIDTGNLLFDAPKRIEADRCQDEARIEVLLSTLSSLGLSSTVVGPLDNSRGHEFRDRYLSEYRIIPMTTPIEIKTSHSRITVFGVSESLKKEIIVDDITAFKKKNPSNFVVVLSQMQARSTKELFHNLEVVDIVVQGQTDTMTPSNPTRLGDDGPWLIDGGKQGQYFSLLVFQNLKATTQTPLPLDTRAQERTHRESLLTARIDTLKKQVTDAPKSRQEFLATMTKRAQQELAELKSSAPPPILDKAHFLFHQIPITKKIDSDSIVKAKLATYEKNVPLLVKKCEATIECPKAGPNEASFVGAQVCKSCHQEAFDVWTNSIHTLAALDDDGKEVQRKVGHSKAWQTLVDDSKDFDRSCIDCHSVGFMKKGGYCRASDVDFRKGVQCESCHGAGSLHAQSGEKHFITRAVSEATCRGCHQVPHIATPESFNYEQKLMKILGKGHGENLLKQLSHKAKS